MKVGDRMEKKEVPRGLCEFLSKLGFYTVISNGKIEGFLKEKEVQRGKTDAQ